MFPVCLSRVCHVLCLSVQGLMYYSIWVCNLIEKYAFKLAKIIIDLLYLTRAVSGPGPPLISRGHGRGLSKILRPLIPGKGKINFARMCLQFVTNSLRYDSLLENTINYNSFLNKNRYSKINVWYSKNATNKNSNS